MSSQFVKNGPMMRVSRLRARVGRTLIAGMGPEPVRPNGHRILNPERLPIPPLGLKPVFSRTQSKRPFSREISDID